MRYRAGGGIAVVGAANRKQAGVVAVAFLEQYIERPLDPRHDREAGCAEAYDGLTRHVLEGELGAADLFAECRRRQRADPTVPPAVRCDLVAGGRDAPHERGFSVGDPAEREEG